MKASTFCTNPPATSGTDKQLHHDLVSSTNLAKLQRTFAQQVFSQLRIAINEVIGRSRTLLDNISPGYHDPGVVHRPTNLPAPNDDKPVQTPFVKVRFPAEEVLRLAVREQVSDPYGGAAAYRQTGIPGRLQSVSRTARASVFGCPP